MPSIPQSSGAELLFLLGVALVTLTLLRRIYRVRRARAPRRTSRAQRPASATSGGDRLSGLWPSASSPTAPPQVQRWEVAMHETARQLAAELDAKAGILEQLIRDARSERERLERLLARTAGHDLAAKRASEQTTEAGEAWNPPEHRTAGSGSSYPPAGQPQDEADEPRILPLPAAAARANTAVESRLSAEGGAGRRTATGGGASGLGQQAPAPQAGGSGANPLPRPSQPPPAKRKPADGPEYPFPRAEPPPSPSEMCEDEPGKSGDAPPSE